MNTAEQHVASTPESPPQLQPVDESLGALLRATREARGLPLDQAARRLRTKPAVLQALENDNFKALGAPVFVRMYLVRYAELLGLAEHEVLGRYKQLGIDQPPPLRPAHSVQPQTRASDLRWLTYPAGFALVAWLGWTVTQQQPDWVADNGDALPERELVQTAAPVDDSASVASTGVDATAPSSSDPLSPERPASTPSLAGEPPVSEPSSADETVALAALDTPVEASSVSGPASGSVTDAVPAAPLVESFNNGIPGPIGSALAGGLEPVDTPLEPDQARLVLEFRDDCWVEIEDGSGQRLVYGLLSADERRSLTGPAPFSIKLGNAQAVQRISLNGEAIDPSLYLPERGSVSRFTLTTPPRG